MGRCECVYHDIRCIFNRQSLAGFEVILTKLDRRWESTGQRAELTKPSKHWRAKGAEIQPCSRTLLGFSVKGKLRTGLATSFGPRITKAQHQVPQQQITAPIHCETI